jgi:diaminohydroxyphosphoribosylaminopyrimidine deaminase/5-amino-6-(5-phosphoribosylamino)uracil reductase
MEEEGRWLNRRFFTFMEKQRPYIILKWAQTADGFVARSNFSSKWISNWLSRKLVHRWRAEEDAILVGTNTAIYDNPALNVRNWHGKNPLRLLIDRHGKVPPTHQLFDRSTPTVVYGQAPQGIESVLLPDGTEALLALLDDLYQRKVQSLIVEGGTRLLQSFIDQGLWDEARIFESSQQHFGTGIAAPKLHGHLHSRESILHDELYIYQNRP